jgi:two-component system sensor histidine kinase DesK
MVEAANPHPGGLFILLITLVIPAYAAAHLGSVTLNVIALGVFAVLFSVSQWITPEHPFAFRLGLFVVLVVVSVWGQWALNKGWLAATVLTAVAAVNLLPLVGGAVLGVVVVTLLRARSESSQGGSGVSRVGRRV